MSKVYVMDNRGREKEATKVRYFKYNNNNYFVYTLDELDNEGYVKLYIKKIVGLEDQPILDEEWSIVKEIVQEVFREIKAGTNYSYEDLNSNEITEIMDSGARVFKLKKIVVDDILSKVIDENEALENDINKKLINSLKESNNNEQNENPFIKSSDNLKDEDLSTSLLNLLKKVEKVSEEENLFSTPESLAYEESKDIKEEFDNSKNIEEIKVDKEDNTIKNDNVEFKKIKPFVVGSVPITKYQEKITDLEQEIKEYQDRFFNLKKEVEQLKNTNDRLNEQVENSKIIISKYSNILNKLKGVLKDI